MIKMKKLITEAQKHGFDLTDFKPGGWERVLRSIGASTTPKKLSTGYPAFRWVGKRGIGAKRASVQIVTGNNPITGGPRGEKNYASYIGIEGDPQAVKDVVRLIKQEADYYKDESPGRRDFI